MSGTQLVLAHANKALMLALLAGMVWRGRLGQCYWFSAYIVATITGNLLSSVWPDRFYTPWFWMVKQITYDILKLAVGLELAYRALATFPGAWRTARRILPALLLVSTVALGWLTPRGSYETVWRWQPGAMTAAVWLLTATALLVTWYQLPIGEWQRAIMLGFAPYLLISAALLRLLHRRGFTFAGIGLGDSVAWLVLMTFWAFAAWRRDEAPESYPLETVTADA